MTCETLKDLVHQYSKESECIEFKNNNDNPETIGEYISALSNTATLMGITKAYLIYGVNDKTLEMVGTKFYPKDAKKGNVELESWLHQLLNKNIEFKIYEIECEGLHFAVFEIDTAKNKRISFSGIEYFRIGSSKRNLKDYPEKERILWGKFSSALTEDWSIGICEEATLNDLSDEAILKAKEAYVTKNPKQADDVLTWDDKTFLNKAKITINGQITRAAIILLGKPESEHYLTPAVAKISWILKDRDNISKDYEHFSCPFILSVEELYGKIRNLKYRYLADGTLFPEEVDSYDPYIIREALNNCIAHQDYTLGGKINVVENEDSKLIFTNSGSFIPKSVENVIASDAPESQYRNRFLANAMVNLNMIDTIGSGIVRMFDIQRKKYFPLPEYSFDNNQVKVVIEGKVLDMNYARKLVQMPELSLEEIILLDKVQKGNTLNEEEVKQLRYKNLIEGKRPNLYISSKVAKETGQKDDYMKKRGIDDDYCKKMILDYLKKFKTGKRADFEKLLLDKLPDILDIEQKKNKVKNNLQSLRKDGSIVNNKGIWATSKTK
jgi:ATP-dependent DNA helicase RecG